MSCMNATRGSICCGCTVQGQCWACPNPSLCNLFNPFNCSGAPSPPPRKTCATTFCPAGYYCHDVRALL